VRFVVDECTGPAVARWLRAHQHDVFSVYDEARGFDDDAVLALAFREDRILITNDTDFGERVFRAGHAHCGVVLMRLSDERAASKIACLRRLLEHHATALPGAFVVIGESSIRIVRR
jgi:predicted nuclease of predicted toxin-antitoxin system